MESPNGVPKAKIALRRPILLGAVALVVIAGGVGIGRWWQGRGAPRYVTAKVTRGDIQRSIGMTGALNPVVTVQVGSYVSGTIKTLSCDYGTEVVVGQECARVDPVPFQLIVDQDKADVGTGEAQIKKDEAALVYAKIALGRDTKLRADGSVSQDQIDSDQNVYDQAIAQIGVDKASLAQKQAALKAAEVNLGYTRIVSPVVGTVITRAIDVGQTVAASLQAPTLFLIGKDLTHMQVDTNVSEADVGGVKLGQDAFFTVQAFPGQTFHGKVWQIREGPITVQNVVTYDVVVTVDNPDRKLFPGMTADTHIVLDSHADVLKVPLPAVRFVPEGSGRTRGGQGGQGGHGGSHEAADARGGGERGGGERHEGSGEGKPEGGDRKNRSRVWVLKDGQLHGIPVVTGIDDGTLIEVRGEGLEEGDTVVVNVANADGARAAGAGNPQSPYPALRQPGPRL